MLISRQSSHCLLAGLSDEGSWQAAGLRGVILSPRPGGGMTPLMFAAMFGRSKVVAQLQAHGASLQRRNRLGISASFMVRVSRWIARLFQRPQFQANHVP